MKDTILTTCGTSLIKNLKRAEVNPHNAIPWLKNKDPLDRVCGAEINSIAHMLKEYGSEIEATYISLYLSDTEDGRETEKILSEILPHFFKKVNVSTKIIEKLTPDNPDQFQRRGLKNFVMQLAKDVQTVGRSRCIMNATGGFKVMVALAQGLANATGISSYYKFEFSDSGMIIPPLPVGLDVGIWLRLHDTLSQLEEADILDQSQYRQITSSLPPIDKNKLNMLIEDTLLEKNQRVYALSALGELYKQLAEASFWEHKKDFIPAEVPPSEKAPKVKHKNNESNMLAFERKHGIGEKLLAIPFVASIRTNYYKKGGKTIKQCHITNADEKELVVQWGNNMGIINYVLNISTAQNEEQLQAACLEINDMLQLF